MFCQSCGAEVVSGGSCPRCGAAFAGAGGAATAIPTNTAASGLSDNAAGALAYVTIIPAIIFLVSDSYNRRRFVRFHSFQSIFLALAWTILMIALSFVPLVGWIIELICIPVFFVLWLVAVFQAYNGKEFQIPVIGPLALKQAESR